VWIPSTETVWEEGVVLAVTGALSTIRTAKGDVVQVDLSTVPCYLANPTVTADVTGLHYIHGASPRPRLQKNKPRGLTRVAKRTGHFVLPGEAL